MNLLGGEKVFTAEELFSEFIDVLQEICLAFWHLQECCVCVATERNFDATTASREGLHEWVNCFWLHGCIYAELGNILKDVAGDSWAYLGRHLFHFR